MSCFHTYFDHYIYGYLELKIMPQANMFVTFYNIPYKQRVRFTDSSKRIIEVFRYPMHYRHFFQNEIRYYIAGYISFWGLIFNWKFFKNIMRANPIFAGFWGILSAPFFLASHYAISRIKDVKAIYCLDGKKIILQTFQDGDKVFNFDVSDLRIINHEFREFICFVDKENMSKLKPIYFCVRNIPDNIPNKLVFEKLLIHQHYLRYRI